MKFKKMGRVRPQITNGFVCVLCKKNIKTSPEYGHNPYPLTEPTDYETMSPRCCDSCNSTKVIPSRLLRVGM